MMSELPMAGLPGESPQERYWRLKETAVLLRSVADDAIGENNRAYERAKDAIGRAEYAEREADLAWFSWQQKLRAGAA